MTPLAFIMVACATLRVTTIMAREDGPFLIFPRIRARFPWVGCVWCLSVWVGFLMVGVNRVLPWVVWGFAASGAAMLLRSFTGYLHDEPGAS